MFLKKSNIHSFNLKSLRGRSSQVLKVKLAVKDLKTLEFFIIKQNLIDRVIKLEFKQALIENNPATCRRCLVYSLIVD